MSSWKTRLLRSGLDGMYYTGAYRLLEPACSGVGVIFTLHHIRTGNEHRPFSPNKILDITPDFLERTIIQVRDLGYDFVTLDTVRKRLEEKDFGKKFVCLTLDDGYLDNYVNALPVFRKYDVPFTIYVATGLPDGTAVFWWQHLEDIIAAGNEIELTLEDQELHFQTRTVPEKFKAFYNIYWALRKASHASQQVAIQQLIDRYEVDCPGFCQRSALSWDMIRELSQGGLATIGAHTLNHYALSKLSPEEVRNEVDQSRKILARHLGREPAHFAYPYGDPGSAGPREFGLLKDLGFATATTTRKGVLFPEHADHLHALPRVSLNGDYQSQRYVPVFLSGAPFALRNRFRHLDVN
jgi:peptidoglycan/xylan/chitin deacetylase (PgdA/CDA1 family)